MDEYAEINTDNTCILTPLELSSLATSIECYIKQLPDKKEQKMWERYLEVTFAKIEELNKLAIDAYFEHKDKEDDNVSNK